MIDWKTGYATYAYLHSGKTDANIDESRYFWFLKKIFVEFFLVSPNPKTTHEVPRSTQLILFFKERNQLIQSTVKFLLNHRLLSLLILSFLHPVSLVPTLFLLCARCDRSGKACMARRRVGARRGRGARRQARGGAARQR